LPLLHTCKFYDFSYFFLSSEMLIVTPFENAPLSSSEVNLAGVLWCVSFYPDSPLLFFCPGAGWSGSPASAMAFTCIGEAPVESEAVIY
jgi:hypothetical protein